MDLSKQTGQFLLNILGCLVQLSNKIYTMNQHAKSAVRRMYSNSINKDTPILQPELEQTLIHLETILMLGQLNVAYYQLESNLQHTTSKLQQKYFKIKMNAFLAIQNYRYRQQTKNNALETVYMNRQGKNVGEQYEVRDGQSMVKIYEKYKRNADYQQIVTINTQKCQQKLQRICNLLIAKNNMLLSFALFRLKLHRQTSIISEKSSKIQTNDSQKSKLLRRSVDKKQIRKSFSVQKSGLSGKNDCYMPAKYQPSRVNSQLNAHTEQKQHADNNNYSSMLHRFLHNTGDKKENKHNSMRKYNTNSASQQRQEKINQLDCLRGKYKKLIDQFSCFSQQFLRVIEEEEYVQ